MRWFKTTGQRAALADDGNDVWRDDGSAHWRVGDAVAAGATPGHASEPGSGEHALDAAVSRLVHAFPRLVDAFGLERVDGWRLAANEPAFVRRGAEPVRLDGRTAQREQWKQLQRLDG